MIEFSSSPAASALTRLKELHRADEAPHDVRVRVAQRLQRLEAPASRRALAVRSGVGVLLVAAAAAPMVLAQSGTVKFILPNATGSGVDAITRAAQPALAKALGASVVVENVVAFELTRAFLEKFCGDTMSEVRAAYNSFMASARRFRRVTRMRGAPCPGI